MSFPKYINGREGSFLFTSEAVGEGHPDKLCDQISDSILDACLEQDKDSKVGCEVCASRDTIMVFGEITTTAKVDYESVVRNVLRNVGYTSEEVGLDCDKVEVLVKLTTQSSEIAQAVHKGRTKEDLGAGDQGIMFGYATDETPEYFPLSHLLAVKLAQRLSYVRKSGLLPYLRPDSKTQVTMEYMSHPEGGFEPVRVHTLLLCTQHDPDVDYDQMKKDLMNQVVSKVVPEKLMDSNTEYLLNVSGTFVVGGPASDSGLTGRKIIVDTYGGWGAHGGGCFSGKDGTKVDRSGSYYARYVAKSLVYNGFCKRVLVQVSYCIGRVDPLSLYVNTYGTVKKGLTDRDLEKIIYRNFNFKVGYIMEELSLRRPIYKKTSVFGHFGREDPDFLWEIPKDLSHEKSMKNSFKEFLRVNLEFWRKGVLGSLEWKGPQSLKIRKSGTQTEFKTRLMEVKLMNKEEGRKKYTKSQIEKYTEEFLEHCNKLEGERSHELFKDTYGWKYVLECLESLKNEEDGEVDGGILDKCEAFLYIFNKNEIFEQIVKLVERLRRGEGDEMPLFGITFSVKDNIALKGYRLTNGETKGPYVPTYNATVLEKLLKTGLILVGKNKLNAFGVGANTVNVKNPFGEEYIVGGSSGGSGAAVGGMSVTCAIGTDTGGSVRGPSSFCSCVGYRPSLGAVSRFGMSELTANLDSIGIITNTVYQSCYLAYLGMGFDVKDMMSSQEVNNLRESMLQVLKKISNPKRGLENDKPLRNVKMGMFDTEEIYQMGFVDEENKRNMEEVERVTKELGAKIKKLKVLPLKEYIALYYLYTSKQVSANLRRFNKYPYSPDNEYELKEFIKSLDPRIKERFLLGEYVKSSGMDVERLMEDLREELVKWVEENKLFKEVEFFITPTVQQVLPKKNEDFESKNMYMLDLFLSISPFLGVCSITLPLRNANRPNSLHLTGGYMQDHRLFEVSNVYEQYFKSNYPEYSILARNNVITKYVR